MKKYFLRITLRDLRNEAWFSFMTEFKGFVERFSPSFLGVDELFILFLTLLDRVDTGLEKIRKSALTEILIRLDAHRDNAFRTLKLQWKTNLFSLDNAKREAALMLEVVFNHYKNVAARLYNEETSLIINLVQELRNNYSEQLATLGLNPAVDELENANRNFEATIMQRDTETAEKPDIKLLEARRETDSCFLDIISTVEARILLEKREADFEPFIKVVNVMIERYKR